jgi:hypothetical protein
MEEWKTGEQIHRPTCFGAGNEIGSGKNQCYVEKIEWRHCSTEVTVKISIWTGEHSLSAEPEPASRFTNSTKFDQMSWNPSGSNSKIGEF